MTKYVAAIDQGTTSTRFMIFDHPSNVVATAQRVVWQDIRTADICRDLARGGGQDQFRRQ